jgi:hypothetical protein
VLLLMVGISFLPVMAGRMLFQVFADYLHLGNYINEKRLLLFGIIRVIGLWQTETYTK